MLKRIALLEACVAALSKMSMVYSSPALWAKPEYYRCLIAVVGFSLQSLSKTITRRSHVVNGLLHYHPLRGARPECCKMPESSVQHCSEVLQVLACCQWNDETEKAITPAMIPGKTAKRMKVHRFLERMAAEASDMGAVASGAHRGVPLRLVEEQAADQESDSGFSTDKEHGFLSAPVSVPAKDVYAHIQVC